MAEVKKGLSKTVRVALSLALACAFFPGAFSIPAAQADAQESVQSYVSEIKFFIGRDTAAQNASNVIPHDFNCGQGSDTPDIYVGYEKTTNKDDAITGLIVYMKPYAEDNPATIDYQGLKYHLIEGHNGQDPDFNYGAGGAEVGLYYTKDKNASPEITDLGYWCIYDNQNNSDTRVKTTYDGKEAHMNGGNVYAGIGIGLSGREEYLTYRTVYDDWKSASQEQSQWNVYEDEVPASTELLYRQMLNSNNTLKNWTTVANEIALKEISGASMPWNLSSNGELELKTSLQDALDDVNETVAGDFSDVKTTTLSLKSAQYRTSGTLVFTNFQFRDTGEQLTTNADQIGTSIKTNSSVTESQMATPVKNYSSSPAVTNTGYSSTRETSYTVNVSDTVTKLFGSETTFTASTSIKIPFVGNADFSLSEAITYSVENSKTVSNETTTLASETLESSVSVEVPAHTQGTVMMQKYNGDVTLNFTNKMHVTYDVYMLIGNNVYVFTGNGNINSSDAVSDLYQRTSNRTLVQGLTNDVTTPSITSSHAKSISNWANVLKDGTVRKAIEDLHLNVPVAPYGGSITCTMMQTAYTAGGLTPLYPLKNITPSVSTIKLKKGKKYNLDKIRLSATDEYGVNWHGFNADTSGRWTVVKGKVSISKNKAGYTILTAKKAGTAVIRYIPSGIPTNQLASSVNNKGVTVKIADIPAKKGQTITVGKAKYKVINASKKKGTVMYVKPKSTKVKSVSIPKTVKYGGVTYKVTAIKASAFKGCSKLKSITIKTKSLSKVGKNAFKGISKSAKIKVPKKKLKAYKKLLKGKGQAKTVKIV